MVLNVVAGGQSLLLWGFRDIMFGCSSWLKEYSASAPAFPYEGGLRRVLSVETAGA